MSAILNETVLLNTLRRRLGSKLFNCLDPNWFMQILREETLILWASYYPKLVKGVRIKLENAIPTYDPVNNWQEYHRYIIPKINEEDEYIGIEKYLFNGQGYDQALTGYNSILADAALGKVRSLASTAPVMYSATFEAPHFCEVYPYRRNHIDFVLTMQRLPRLSEIPFGYYDTFKDLFVTDVKWAIYEEYPNARETNTINGVEVDTKISDFSGAEQHRDEIKNTLGDDWMLDPSRWAAMNYHQYA